MTLEEARDQLAAALTRAAAKHGRPNAFSCGELALHFGGPPPRLAGRIGRRYLRSLWDALGGEKGWGPSPTFTHGCFLI